MAVFACDDFTLTGDTDREIERFRFFDIDDPPEHVSPGTGRRLREYATGSNRPVVGPW